MWHLSRSDLRKIYDERHFAVCVCQTPEQAILIIRAVNLFQKESAESGLSTGGSEHAQAEPPVSLPKPDLMDLARAAQGEMATDCTFGVVRRR